MRPVALLALIACGSPAATTPTNLTPPPVAAPLPIDAELGWLGFAAAKSKDSWIPAGEGVVVPGKNFETGVTLLTATDPAGATSEVVFSDTMSIEYGCDGNKLDVTVLAHTKGAVPQPGVVFLRDANKPKPAAIAITPRSTATERTYIAGPIAVAVSRRDRTHGALAIAWDGREVYRRPFERVTMAGAPDEPIDVNGDGVAIPVLEGAWSIGPSVVLVFRIRGYEGMNFSTVVVNASAGRVVETMGAYLYHCAF